MQRSKTLLKQIYACVAAGIYTFIFIPIEIEKMLRISIQHIITNNKIFYN